jgi:hypothetical protein
VQHEKAMTDDPEWEVEFYSDESGREPCREWADRLSPQKRAAFTATIRLVLARRGLDVIQTEYARSSARRDARSSFC